MAQLQLTTLNATTVLMTTPMPARQEKITLDILLQRKEFLAKQIINLSQQDADNDALITRLQGMGIQTAADLAASQAQLAQNLQVTGAVTDNG